MFKLNFEKENYQKSLPPPALRSVNLDVEITNSPLKNSDKIQKTEI